MATLHHFPSVYSISSSKLSHSFHFSSPYLRVNPLHNYCCSTIFASSVKKNPRASTKPKSDEDLRDDIKDFLSSFGLPQNHVPTTKELSSYGRQDLANIVRRRGYKYIRQLLETSFSANLTESNVDVGQVGNPELHGQNEKHDTLSIEVLSNESEEEDINSFSQVDEGHQKNDQIFVAESLSLREKVSRFIQLGELDETEDGKLGITNEEFADEKGKKIELEPSDEPKFAFSMSNGNVSLSALNIEESALESTSSSYISAKEDTNTSGEDLDDKKRKLENQSDITHLRFLLHKKELELTELKQQIEKEKLALSLLHSKAANEISKAEELVSAKETELLAAEENLSDLREVEIQYSGDGEIVELAGSFNGWNHRIQMEPELSSSIINPTGSRMSRVWRTILWLYPGVYEIKFVVDGDWRIDPRMESVTRNGANNNILRVDR